MNFRQNQMLLAGLCFLVCIGLQCSFIQLIHYKSKPPIVVIIKAAGFIEGQKQDGVDGITEATSFGRNVHVITESLQHELKELGVESEIVRFNDHRRIEEISKDTYVELLVFAGPAYSSQFPQQLKNVVPKLKEYIFREKIRCTSMTTCRFMDSGQWTVKSFNDELKALGITTTDGLIIHHEYEDKDWESKVKAFAEQLQKTLQDELSSM